jgi:pilus assembly protein FimV
MFITCQECNTTYRLDEKLLKPAGSKVRCSQCQFVFVAQPPSPEPSAPAVLEPSVQAPWMDEAQPTAEATDTFGGQELEGIDLAEFDALLEQDPAFGPEPGVDAILPAAEQSEVDSALDELDSVDLDFDFETALEPEEDSRDVELTAKDAAEEIDLDMDFNIFDDDPLVGEKEMLTNPDAASLNSMDAPVAEKQDVLAPGGGGAPDAEPALDDMDLDLDFDLDSESQAQAEDEKVSVVEAQTHKPPMKDDLELGDLDFELEEDSDQPAQITEEPELSLDDDRLPDPDESMPEEMVVDDRHKADDASDLDLDFDLDLDLESDQPDASPNTPSAKPMELAPEQVEAAQASFDDIDDLDLSDLDTLMTTTGDVRTDQDRDESDLDLDLDMDLELDSDPDSASSDASASDVAAAPRSQEVSEEIEDLDFSLDAEEDNIATSSSDPGDTLAEEEIDLSDIEQMLGSDSAEVKKAERYVQPREENLGMGDDDAIDIAEIESAIDDASMIPERKNLDDNLDDQELVLDLDFNFDKPFKETAGDLEGAGGAGGSSAESLEFDLEMELEGAPVSKARQIDADDDELDLSDFGDLVEEDTNRTSNSEIINSGDIELEFQLEGDGEEQESNVKAAPVKRPAVKAPEKTSFAAADPLSAQSKPIAPKPKPFRTKKKTSKSLVALLILFMLGGSGYGLYYAVMEKGVVIPYVSDYVKKAIDYYNPGPIDPDGILNLSTLDINNKFIDNEEAGRLFVITGQVRNSYSTSRDKIRLEGKLYTTGKVLAETAHCYAGFVINDQDLASLPISEINRRLNSPPQGSSVETAVGPGQNLGFMLVFANLPPVDQLDQFDIALISSAPRQ